MYIYLLILRLLHITGGVMWAGAAFFLAFYIFPAVIRSGPDGSKMMQAISTTNRFPVFLATVSTVTLISGVLLIWHLSYGFTPSWFGSPYGASLAVGGTMAIIAYFQGLIINRPGVDRMQRIGMEIMKRATPPTEAERVELTKLRDRLYLSTRLIAYWLLMAVVLMGIARYL